MRIRITSMLAAGLFCLPLTALAADTTPRKGMSQDAVRSQFGAPEKQLPAVGNPPISRWVYKDFTVYFEGNLALHSVVHARALAQPGAESAVSELPPIEEIGDTPSADAQAADATAAESTPAEDAAPAENTFQFDPVSGRIIEIGPDGQPLAPATAQPGSAAPAQPAAQESDAVTEEQPPADEAEPADAPAAEEAPAEEQQAEEPVEEPTEEPVEQPAEQPQASEESDDSIAPAAVPAAAATAPATSPAPAPAPEATTGQPQFRFDPVTGRIVVDDPAAQSAPAAATESAPAASPTDAASEAPPPAKKAEQPAKEEPKAEAAVEEKPAPAKKTAAPEPKKAEESTDEESGGFSVDWNNY